MKLFLIHVGFYDPEIIKGLYEQHSNYFVSLGIRNHGYNQGLKCYQIKLI